MQKQAWTWTTEHLPAPARMVRWGHFGAPVLIFPTAGGDFEEIERFQLIGALAALIDNGKIKVYSLDGIATRAWLAGTTTPAACAKLQEHYDAYVYEDVLQRIRIDCKDPRIEPILVGASLGAFHAVCGLCRHPDAFRLAIGVSGSYDLAAKVGGVSSEQLGLFAAVSYLTRATESQLEQLRRRRVILGSGEGDYETPEESRRLAEALGSSKVPSRLSLWGPDHDHNWSSWREQLPRLLAEQL